MSGYQRSGRYEYHYRYCRCHDRQHAGCCHCRTGATGFLGTDAFQEVDLVGITQPITKWSYQIRRAEDVAWAVARAFYIARSGRPGPVVLDFAKNAQVDKTEYTPVEVDYVRSYLPVPEMEPEAIRQAAELINAAERPLVLVGQGVELGNAQNELRAFIEKADMPAGCTLLGLSGIAHGSSSEQRHAG